MVSGLKPLAYYVSSSCRDVKKSRLFSFKKIYPRTHWRPLHPRFTGDSTQSRMVATWTQPFHSRAPLGPSFVHVVSLGIDYVPFGACCERAEQFVLIFLHVQLELTLDSFCFKLSLYRYAVEISWVPLDPIRSQTSRVLHCAQLIFCPCTGGSF